MENLAKAILAVLFGFLITTLTVSHYKKHKCENKIETMKQDTIKIKDTLNTTR